MPGAGVGPGVWRHRVRVAGAGDSRIVLLGLTPAGSMVILQGRDLSNASIILSARN
jgi:hypothetical protein